jgi:hypothetical protein
MVNGGAKSQGVSLRESLQRGQEEVAFWGKGGCVGWWDRWDRAVLRRDIFVDQEARWARPREEAQRVLRGE